MKIINRRSPSTKLKRCGDFIRRKLKTICCTRLQYESEDEEDDDHNKDRKLKTICPRKEYKLEDDQSKDLKLKAIYKSEDVDDHNKDRKLKTICPIKEYKLEDDQSEDLKLKAIYKSEDVDDDKDRWSKQLPDDVMQLILLRLPMSDFLSCRHVCPCWRATIDSKGCLPAPQLPRLLVDTCESFYIKDDCFVSDRKICKPERYCGCYCAAGTIHGWLIMEARQRISGKIATLSFYFLNPVSGARVMLPSHPAPIFLTRVKVVASSAPTKPRLQQQRTCYVTCLHLEGEGRLAFCTPYDKSWTFIEAKAAEKALKCYDIEIVDGKLYAVGSHALDFLMVFDIQLDTNGRRKHTYTAERLVTLHPNVERIVEDKIYHRDCYLAKGSESKDELFMILRKTSDFGRTQGFQVLKLEYNVTNGPQWVETADLGDRVIFLGGVNNKCISSHDQTLERNSIYFAFDWYWTLETGSGVFSLTNRSIKPLTFPKDQSHTKLNYTLWFTPNPW